MHRNVSSPFATGALRLLAAISASALAPALFTASPAWAAQRAGTGSIQGRVFNPATGAYVRNAEVRVQGTDFVAVTENDGSFRFDGVPAGEVTLVVNYIGYAAEPQALLVAPDRTATREINLASSLAGSGSAADPMRLGQFVVSSEREGNAKAIMEQRRNMNIATSVASDVFGDVAEGNVGEFLKYLPGVELEYVEGVSRGPRLGGLDPQYTGLTIDGVKLASADAFMAYGNTDNGAAGDAVRSVSFEQMSINSVESIEISRTASADMDADAPGGTVNLKTKRAFDRKGRRISWQLSASANSEEFTLSKTYGPQHRREHHVRPNFILDYSDVFLDQRLGIALNISQSQAYSEQYRVTHTYNKTATAADPRPMVLTQIQFKDGPRRTEQFGTTLTADFKATPRLVLSLTSMFNTFLNNADARLVQWNLGTNNTNATTGRATILGDLTDYRTNGNPANTGRTVSLPGSGAQKLTNTITLVPSFEYKVGRLTVDGALSYSKSKNDYENIVRGIARSATLSPIVVDFRMARPDRDSHEWTITQLGGPDWSDLANYADPRITEEGRFALTEIYNGQLNARYVLPVRLPTFVKFGGKWNEEVRETENRTPLHNWRYVGPGGGTTGSWAGYRSPHAFDMGTTNALTVANMPPVVNLNAIADLFRARPEQFVGIATADNYYTGAIANQRDMLQNVTAAYGMANTRLGPVQLQGGIRWERTVTESKEYDPLTAAQVQAAGFPISATTRRATTIEGLDYQFLSRPRVIRRGEYDHFFPSVSAKYLIRPNLIAQAGYSYAISRPPVNAISGVWNINDVSQVITAPNPELKPELSDNIVARIAYYFEPVGSLSLTVTQNDISNFRQTRIGTAAELGFDNDPAYSDYEFNVPFNVEGNRRFRTLELGYSQALSFLPDVLRGFNVNASYSRTYANERRPGVSPHRVTTSLSYARGRFNFRFGAIWSDDAPWTTNETRYREETITCDLSGGVRLTSRVTVFFQGRRIFNESLRIFEGTDATYSNAALFRYENYGANWVFGLKGTF